MEFLALLVFIRFAGGGAQSGMHATVGKSCPDECRGAGVSWAGVVSRFGAVVRPFCAGAILAHGFSVQTLFLVMVIPILLFSLCAVTLAMFHLCMRGDASQRETFLMTAELSGAI